MVKERGNINRLIVYLSRYSIVRKVPYLTSHISEALQQAEADEAKLINALKKVAEPTVIFNACLPIELSDSDYQKFLACLKPRKDIQKEINRYVATYFKNKKVTAVHVRHGNGGDIMAHRKYWVDEHKAIANICRAVEKVQTVLDNDGPVFLCTDSQRISDIISSKLPNVITRRKYFRPDQQGELHDRSVIEKENSTNLGRDAIIEMFLLAKGDGLVCYPPHSYFSFYARHCRNNQQVKYTDEFINEIL